MPPQQDWFRELTFRNLEKATLRYREAEGLQSKDLEVILEHMHAKGWRISMSMVRSGIPEAFYEQFTAACEGGTVWKKSRFTALKKVPKAEK